MMTGSLGTSTSSGYRSALTRCSNCHEKDLRINLLEAQKQLPEAQKQVLETKLRMMEAKLDMATYPNHDHACQSDAILRDLLGDMDKFHM
jgi:cytochrome c553